MKKIQLILISTIFIASTTLRQSYADDLLGGDYSIIQKTLAEVSIINKSQGPVFGQLESSDDNQCLCKCAFCLHKGPKFLPEDLSKENPSQKGETDVHSAD